MKTRISSQRERVTPSTQHKALDSTLTPHSAVSQIQQMTGNPMLANPGDIFALQRLIGNQATIRLLTPPNTVNRDLGIAGKIKNARTKRREKKLRNLSTVKNGVGNVDVSTLKPTAETTDGGSGVLETGAEVTGWGAAVSDIGGELTTNLSTAPKSAAWDGIYASFLRENRLPRNTPINRLNEDQVAALEEKQYNEGGYRSVVSNDNTRTDLGIAASGFGAVSGGLGAIGGFVGFVESVKKWRTGDDGFTFELGLDMLGQGAQTGFGVMQVGANSASAIAGGIARGNESLENAAVASNAAYGISETLGGVSSSAEAFLSAVRIIPGIISIFKDSGEKSKKELAMDVVNDAIKSVKGALNAAKGLISGLRLFLEIAGKAGDFVNAFPLIGASINIFIQFLDMVIQAVEALRQTLRIIKARKTALALRLSMKNIVDDDVFADLKKEKIPSRIANDDVAYLRSMYIVNMRRVRRAIIPLVSSIANIVADLISVGASVLNIVGVATSAAYGAGVAIMAAGYAGSASAAGIKIGAAMAMPVAKGVRWAKQKGRDRAANDGKIAKKFFRSSKSTAEKDKNYERQATYIIDFIKKLPRYGNNTKGDYQEAYMLLKATGVNTKALFAPENSDPRKQMRLIIDGMKKRE